MDSIKDKKLPKQPKKSATARTWENYSRKLQEVEKHNKQAATLRKRRDKLTSDYDSLKRKHTGLKGLRKKPKKTASLDAWQNAMADLKESIKQKQQKEAAIAKANKLRRRF